MEKWLHVLRIRCEHVEQGDMFAQDRGEAAVIVDAIGSHPEAEIGGGNEWHIAGSERFADGAISFQIGRIQNVTNPQYDERRQKFYESEGERAPYAHGVFDSATQACVIERKANLFAKAADLAPKLQKLLNEPKYARDAGVRIVVDELRDPEGFIEQVRASEKVVRFQFVAEFKNPHDVQRLIHGPAEEYNELIGGEKTTVETRGSDLDKGVIEDMARSAASVGDPASATIKDAGGAKSRTIYLRGTPLLEKVVFGGLEDMKDQMLIALRAAYNRLRKPQHD